MDKTDDLRNELRQIEDQVIDLALRAHLPSAADHARALLAEIKRIERIAMRRSAD